ncbi:MAG: tetratricopeptide repeat protein [Candidatus Eremiobacteraeota bacterium]|nr:tetratricopeptide repeat protein [Candidatus Eremiobacteraeota bacterium]MCW5868787.1 tetratricopeptide repeat protein [Candidatus Eremiobacteraeota bacterium]
MSIHWKKPVLYAALGCSLLISLPALAVDEGLQVQMLKQMFRLDQAQWPQTLKDNAGLIDDSFFERIDQRIRWSATNNQVEDAIRFAMVGDFACDAIGRQGGYRLGLIEAFTKAGNSELAQGLVDNILITDPNNQPAHFLRAGFRRDAMDTGGALEDYQWCIDKNYQVAASYYFMAAIYVVMDKQAEARRLIEKCLSVDPHFDGAEGMLAKLMPQTVDPAIPNIFNDIPLPENTQPVVQRKVDPKMHDQYFAKAEAAFRAGKFKEAEDSYVDAINADRNHPDDWIFLAALHYRLGKFDLGLRELRAGITLDPKRVDAWRYVGCCYERMFDRSQSANELKFAKQAYQKALELQPGDPVATMGLERLATKKPKAADS